MLNLTDEDIASVDFARNCTSVGQLYNDYSKWLTPVLNETIVDFYRQGLPEKFRNITIDDVIQLDRELSSRLSSDALGYASIRATCHVEICRMGGLVGNPDIGGVGVSVVSTRIRTC